MHLLIRNKKLHPAEKIQLVISYILQLSLIAAIALFIYKENWLNVFLTSGIFIITLLPSILRRNYKVRLPIEVDLVVILFTYTSLFLGQINSFYNAFWWWHLLLHGSSGVLLGIAGFLLIYVFNQEEKIPLKLNRTFMAIFSFTFALAIGVLWEIFEFSMDSFFGFKMQRSSLVDTMTDLIIDTLGTIVIVLIGYWYSRKKDRLLIDRWVHSFFKKSR